MKLTERRAQSGLSLIEVMIAVLLLAVFFASIFELNAVCLRYIDASKESAAALQIVHDRVEVLRNVAFGDLTDTDYVEDLLSNPANESEFAKSRATEVVTLSAYPAANGVTQLTRGSNGAVTVNSTAAELGATLVRVTVTSSWKTTFGGRTRSEQTTTIVSNGTKK